jgi:hypothetical protein
VRKLYREYSLFIRLKRFCNYAADPVKQFCYPIFFIYLRRYFSSGIIQACARIYRSARPVVRKRYDEVELRKLNPTAFSRA